MHFHEGYKAYSEAVIGGRGCDIEITKKRMFRMLAEVDEPCPCTVYYYTCYIFVLYDLSSKAWIWGMTMRIYPCLTAGYFILFLMYAEIIFYTISMI